MEIPCEEAPKLPLDVIRLIADRTDWKTVPSLCHVFKGICRDQYWKRRTIEEFGKDSWNPFYQYGFHNYLAARVQNYFKTGNCVTTNDLQEFIITSKPERRLTMETLSLEEEQIQENGDLSTDQMRTVLRKIKRHAKDTGDQLPEVPFEKEPICRFLRAYFGLDEDDRKAREVIQISKFLVSYLKRHHSKDFCVKKISLTYDETTKIQMPPQVGDGRINPVINAQNIIDEYSLVPYNILQVIREGKHWGYLYYHCGGNLYYLWKFDTFETIFASFEGRMMRLGICYLHYNTLYPRVTFR